MIKSRSLILGSVVAALFMLAAPALNASAPAEKSSVSVECVKGSGLIQVNIENHRKIGNVVIEVRDAKGDVLYREEGKAMTGELVRRLDKGMFPNGPATVTVETRDFRITRAFEVK